MSAMTAARFFDEVYCEMHGVPLSQLGRRNEWNEKLRYSIAEMGRLMLDKFKYADPAEREMVRAAIARLCARNGVAWADEPPANEVNLTARKN
jgi:hypothetical protein